MRLLKKNISSRFCHRAYDFSKHDFKILSCGIGLKPNGENSWPCISLSTSVLVSNSCLAGLCCMHTVLHTPIDAFSQGMHTPSSSVKESSRERVSGSVQG